jgi:hypothetical protein
MHGTIARLRGYNNLFLLALVTLFTTICLLGVSIFLYRVSGTAQLDLSRPGYETARDNSETVKTDEFSSVGAINDKTIEEFNTMFDARAKKIKAVDAFKPDALSDSAFGIAE